MDNLNLFLAIGILVMIAAGVILHNRYRSAHVKPPRAQDIRIKTGSEDSIPTIATPPTENSADQFTIPQPSLDDVERQEDSLANAEEELAGLSPKSPDAPLVHEAAPVQVPEDMPAIPRPVEERGIDEIMEPPIEDESRALYVKNLIEHERDIGAAAITDHSATDEEATAHPSLAPHKTRQSPADHGGAPRRNHETESPAEKLASRKKSRTLKPEIMCWKEGRRWVVGVETPEEYQKYLGLEVSQNDTPLTQDDDGRWLLPEASGTVSVRWQGAERPVEINLDQPYLLFKLAGQTISRGRKVRTVTSGLFLVILPEHWHRSEQISTPATLSPDPVSIAGYRAHYFSLDRASNGRIAFRGLDGISLEIPTETSRYELVGVQLLDASDDIGPLFGEGPPRLRSRDEHGWDNVLTIVVGQEGQGRRRWRAQPFSPLPDQMEQDLPDELTQRHGGWYFIRLYDIEDELLESLDFRFVSALRDIKISPHEVIPAESGHAPVNIEFLHDMQCSIELIQPVSESDPVEHSDLRTSLIVPRDPGWDETRWAIHLNGTTQPVEAIILVERVWWSVSADDVEGQVIKWADTPLTIWRDFVTATSKHCLWFRLPRLRWTSQIHVGFERQNARAYYISVTEREASVPLSHFEGAQEIEDREQDHLLKLWIRDGSNQVSGTVAVIPASRAASSSAAPPQVSRRLRPTARRVRHYLKRLGRKTRDTVLCEMINDACAKWSTSFPTTAPSAKRVETACIIALAWEYLRASGVKPLGHRKRWIRRLLRLASVHPETMQRLRESYKASKSNSSN